MKRLITIFTLGLLLIAGQVWGAGYHATGLTAADSRSSFAAGDSWLAWDALDFSAYGTGNWEVILTDSSGYRARGIAGVVGSGETLGVEIVNDNDFTGDGSAWHIGTPWSYDAGNNQLDATDAGGTNLCWDEAMQTLAADKLHFFSMTVSNYSSGETSIRIGGVSGIAACNANETTTEYRHTDGNQYIYIRGAGAFNGSVDEISIKQVTEPAATAIHILDGPSGSEAWAEIDSSFDYNNIVDIQILPAATLHGVTLEGVTVN